MSRVVLDPVDRAGDRPAHAEGHRVEDDPARCVGENEDLMMRCVHSCVAAWVVAILVAVSGSLAQPKSGQSVGQPVSRGGMSRPTSAPADSDGVTAFSRLGGVSTTQPAAAMPDVVYVDQALLVQTARRAFRERVVREGDRGVGYRPPALKGLTGVVHLTLRSDGAELARAESREMDVMDAAVAAGALLARSVAEKKLEVADGGDGLGLEFELLGPREYLAVSYGEGGTWSDELLHSFEPAVEGIGVEFRGKRAWTRPSEVISLNYTPDVALQAAESGIDLRHAHKVRFPGDIRYFRFRSYHLWQQTARDLPVALVRGTTVVPPEPMGPAELDAAIERLGAYLHYRQNRDGWFSHEYQPSSDRYGEGNSALVQMRALRGIAAYTAWCGRREIAEKASRGVDKSIRFLRPLSVTKVSAKGEPEVVEAGMVAWFPGHACHLESSAHLLMAMTALPSWATAVGLPTTTASAGGVAPTSRPVLLAKEARARLIEGILVSQDAEGRIEMALRPREEGDPEDMAAAGWALLALAGSDPTFGDVRIEEALTRGLIYYGDISDDLGPRGAAALSRAFSLGYAWTNDARASRFVFGMLDRFVRLQVTEDACPWPELHGAINVGKRGVIGVDTALYLAALADGVALAERVGDERRANSYRAAVLAAARFVLQLEVREVGCYYVRSWRDVLGGVREAPWNNRIRVDHCAEALLALMRAREALYGAASAGRGG